MTAKGVVDPERRLKCVLRAAFSPRDTLSFPLVKG
jgi:hypothetical protein